MTARRKTYDYDHDHDNDDQPTGKTKTGKAYDISYSHKVAYLSAVTMHPKMTMAGAKAAAMLMDFHNQTLRCSWPSLDTLAEGMQVSRSTVKAAVALLVELGFFKKEAFFIAGTQSSNRLFPIMVETTDKGRWIGFELLERGRSVARGGAD